MAKSGIQGMAVSRSDIFRLPPSELKIQRNWNCRDFDDPENAEHVRRLKESIRAKGVQEALTVRMQNGTVVVTNGECRLRAIRELIDEGHEVGPIPVQTEGRYSSDADHIESQITRNSGKPFTPLEQARVFARLIELGRTEAEIAAAAGLSAERVRQILMLQKATEPTKALIREGKVSATTVQRALEREKDPEKAERAVQTATEKAEAEGARKATPRHLGERGRPEAAPRPPRRNFQELLAEVVSYAEASEGDLIRVMLPAALWDKIKDVRTP